MAIEKDTVVTFTVTVEEVNTVLAGLQELPAKTANPLTQKILKQAKEQLPNEEEKTVE
ncbi:hypothetical protein UFOVP218_134 [uncultured Caudovirales phage]|uniref:Uncharacterized protein n=1 Tax=uncultured Caudovirales phage TaxID=2100421 RepID=A0A6J7WLZ0_9CAUD|nr:hypothetical protein UFOVP218_134 [uncultured Caudovirales phage]